MRWGRWWWVALWWAGCCSLGMAQAALVERLRKLPVSIGENTVITRQAGESWVDIGIREYVGYAHLRRANAGNITTAHRLFIPGRHQVPALTSDGLVVNLPELMDFRWENGKVVAWYPIAIGRVTARWNTPEGDLKVISRISNPTWERPSWAGGGKMPPGPKNPLGDRWIGLNRPGYGLHGTNDPTSIGRIVSHGCIRHFPPHIHRLFAQIRIGMPVIITYQTVTVGMEGGVIYLAVFPDIYARGSNAPHNVRHRLASFGLDGALTAPELARRIAQADGIARPLLGSKTKVSVNLHPVDLPLGPTFKRGTAYLPVSTLAGALQAQVTWDPASKTVTLRRGILHVSFANAGTFTVLGTHFVPIRDTVESLGGIVLFSRENIQLIVW